MPANPLWKLQIAVVAGGAAGDHTATGIRPGDQLAAVIQEDGTGETLANLVDEFTITAADTINNTGGTATTADRLIVYYHQQTRR